MATHYMPNGSVRFQRNFFSARCNLTFSEGGYVRNAVGSIIGYITKDGYRNWTVRDAEGSPKFSNIARKTDAVVSAWILAI